MNAYLKDATGEDFTAKDFRTWAGTVLAAAALAAAGDAGGKVAVAEAIRCVARRLGNTPAVCRSCYVHPAVVAAYLDAGPGGLAARTRRCAGLTADEARVLAVLRGRVAVQPCRHS